MNELLERNKKCMSKKSHSERFFEIVCNYNPYFSSAMDVDVPVLPDYSDENVLENINKMGSLLKDIKVNREKKEENQYLKQSIITTKFFLENNVLWNNPFYYYYRLESTLEICWNCYSVINGKTIKRNIVQKRLYDLERYIDTAIANMAFTDIGKFDCLYGISKFKNANEKLFGFIQDTLCLDLDRVRFKIQTDKMCSFLEKKKKESKFFFIPYRAEILGKYIFLESGIRFTKESLKRALYESLRIEIGVKRKKVVIQGESINSILSEIISAGESIFGKYDRLEETINYRYISKEESGYLNYIGYIPNSVDEKESLGTFIYNDNFLERKKIDKILGIVHEIYPGHHYMYCMNKLNNEGEISKILYESTAFSEGWAKYCEYIYASQIFDEKEFNNSFLQQMERISLIAITSFEIHFEEKNYEEVYKYLCEYKGGKYANTANSIILQAYSSPIESISVILGYMFFYKNQDKIILEDVYRKGAWIMKGKEI